SAFGTFSPLAGRRKRQAARLWGEGKDKPPACGEKEKTSRPLVGRRKRQAPPLAGRRKRQARPLAGRERQAPSSRPSALPAQPQSLPAFCSFSHAYSGAKYSRIALASISPLPVSSFKVCCQGWLAPSPSIFQNFAPASLLP